MAGLCFWSAGCTLRVIRARAQELRTGRGRVPAGQAFDLDGVDQCVTVPSTAALNPSGSFTASTALLTEAGYAPRSTTIISYLPPVKQGPGYVETSNGTGNVRRTYLVGFDGLVSALDYVEALNEHPGTWNSDTHNCVHETIRTASAAGVALPANHDSPEMFGFGLPASDP